MRILCGAILALLSFAPRGASADTSLASPAVRAAIDGAVTKIRAEYSGKTPVPAVLVGVWNASGSYLRAYGFADLKAKRPLSTADHFRIGSNTKTFVVAIVLQLVDEGKLKLDDPIGKFSLGVTVPNGNHITVRQLCEMRSGLVEAYDTPEINKLFDAGKITGSSVLDSRTIVRWAVAQKPAFAPGTKYMYSNTNYLLLGLLIEALTHDTVANQVRTRLIEPLGLHETSTPSTQAMPAPWARGYGLDKNKNWEDVSGTIPVSLMGSAGDMISDMHDMHGWIVDYVTGKISAPATHRALLTCVPIEGNIAFGLGLGCSAGYYGYTGGLPGYNTANYYMPATGTFILAWVTVQADKPLPGVANSLIRAIARVVTPASVPFNLGSATESRSGL